MRRSTTVLVVLALVVAAAAGAWLARSLQREQGVQLLHATALSPPQPLPEFSLLAENGRPITRAAVQDQWSLLFFGFTHCPDICPTTLSSIARAFKALGRPDRVQVLFITPDPERDTLPVLAKYVPAFDADFLGLRGGLDDTRKVASEFKIFFAKSRGSTPGAYSVDHSAQSFVLDARGRLRLLVTHERLQEDLTHDLRELLRERA